MNKYELMGVVNASLAQEERDSIFKDVVDIVGKSGGKVINNQVWLDKHKITFNLKKCPQVTYYLVNFESAPANITKMKQSFKLNEKILRFLILKLGK